MEAADSPFFYEVTQINQAAPPPTYAMYSASITTEAETVDVLQVVQYDIVRDYRATFGDEMIITVVIPSGTFLKRIQPYQENLKFSLTKTLLGSTASDTTVTTQEFKAILILTDETNTLGAQPATTSENSANLVGIEMVHLQLQELVFENIRTEMVGGIFKRTTPFDLLISLLFNSIQNQDVDEANKVLGVNQIPPNNTVKRDHIIIPHGTPLSAVGDLLQTQLGGIYSTGLGLYLQKGYWNVWPLYDFTRYDTAERTATFLIIPDPRMKGTEKTYREIENHFIAIITGGVKKIDTTEDTLLNKGNAVRFPDSNAMMESFVTVSGNKAVANRSVNNNEYVAVERRGDTNVSRVTTNLARTNVYNEASRLSARAGAFVQLIWENANPDLIEGGLQCEVGFTVEGEARYVNGVVVHAHVISALAGTGLHQRIHQCTIEVIVMIDRNDPDYDDFIKTTDAAAATTNQTES